MSVTGGGVAVFTLLLLCSLVPAYLFSIEALTMGEEGQEMAEAGSSEVNEEEEKEEVTCCGLLTNFWEEIKNYKKFFNLNDCAEGILLRVFLPANDIISDFLVAEKLFQSEYIIVQQWFIFFAYYFIAWPVARGHVSSQ